MSQKRTSNTKYTPQPTSNRFTYILAGVALLVVVVVVVVAILWQRGGDEPRNDGYGSVNNSAVELVVQGDGVVQLAVPGASRTVDIFEDPMCPFCGQLEVKHGQELAQKIDNGTIGIRYHMVVLPQLNEASASGNYSSRAVAASHCVSNSADAVVYSAFHATLFSSEFQPKENGDTDHSDAELADMAKQNGASEEIADCITSGSMATVAAADAETARAALAASGAAGTPGVLVDGSLVDALRDSGWVESIG
ncbi:thioredoxin domain-containing protein [Rhodococcus sp. G-MC3]|uniref:DsbA family protein n=1 Tax=Rhodococcus sp. G-MC3 TaxID=3046209 RepID=UPI0024BBBA47|nr:thioredoxin domain-containing protein [Rhodococcus sp. G-MC3]MDJ0392043.1 thioredoxin domain-containing protein [Rhodococcus sp. G-MC3]